MSTKNFKFVKKIFENFFDQIGIELNFKIKFGLLVHGQNKDKLELIIDDFKFDLFIKFEKHDDFNFIKHKKISEFIITFPRAFFEKVGFGKIQLAQYLQSIHLQLNWIDLGRSVKYIGTYSLDADHSKGMSGRYIANIFFNPENKVNIVNGFYKENPTAVEVAEYVNLKGEFLNESLIIYLFSKNHPEEYNNIFGGENYFEISKINDLDEKLSLIEMFYL